MQLDISTIKAEYTQLTRPPGQGGAGISQGYAQDRGLGAGGPCCYEPRCRRKKCPGSGQIGSPETAIAIVVGTL